MRRLKIGIRPQLIILVCFSSLFSLLILAVVTGVYFSTSLLNSRTERLEVIAQLKTSQVRQSIQFVFYQVYFLLNQQLILTLLSLSRAGNNSQSVFTDTQDTLDQFLQLLELFAGARLYNLNLKLVTDSYSNQTNLLSLAIDLLYPLAENTLVPQALLGIASLLLQLLLLLLDQFYFTGPVQNTLDSRSSLYMSLTVPVLANTSILLSSPSIAGYLTVIALAMNIQAAVNDLSTVLLLLSVSSTSDTGTTTNDYLVLVVKPWQLDSSTGSNSSYDGFEAVFPSNYYDVATVYPLNQLPMVETAFLKDQGSSKKVKLLDSKLYAMAYTRIEIDPNTWWSVIIQQARPKFMAPINKLRDIIIGVVIGIGVFMCLLTFPLAVWFIHPITKLKEATEAITTLKKKTEKRLDKLLPPPYATNSLASLGVRTSLHELVMLYGIRLPGRIPRLKKVFKDEFTELSEAFNIMTEELDKQYTHLESRVKQRTKELEVLKIEAETANEAKTVFIANISHELRTPLNGILGMTSIALDERDPSKIADLLRLIHRLGELLLHILTELLTYSKNTLNRLKLEKLTFEILDIVNQVQSIFGKLALDQRVTLKIFLRPNEIRRLILFGDLNRIIQVVMNLVSNSLKFTPVDGSVVVDIGLLGIYDMDASREEGFKKVCIMSSDTEGEHPPVTLEFYKTQMENAFLDELKELPLIPELVEEVHSDEHNIYNGNGNVNNDANTHSNRDFGNGDNNDNDAETINARDKNLPKINKELPKIKRAPSKPTVVEDGLDPSLPTVLSPLRHSNRPKQHLARRKSSVQINNVSYKLQKLIRPKNWVLQIKVTDTGPGIEPSLQEKIFEPFIQGDQSLSRSYGGTGLGLSICRQLATMMKGTLTLESEVGKGSEFTFVVPLPQVYEIDVPENQMHTFCDDEYNPDLKHNRKVAFVEDPKLKSEDSVVGGAGTSANTLLTWTESHGGTAGSSDGLHLEVPSFEKPELITRGSTGTAATANSVGLHSDSSSLVKLVTISSMRVLVAEDNMVNQEVIRRMLKLEGYPNLTMACNGQEAIDLVAKSMEDGLPFDLVFMDIQMPKVDGLLATRQIRQKLNYSGPIIALTAFADESNVRECLAAGMLNFLLKPIKRNNLREVMGEFRELESESDSN